MKQKIEYTEEPLGNFKVVDDFLPPPEELVFREEEVNVTLSLSRSSIDFFKREAEAHHTPYQEMIGRLLDRYAAHATQ